MAPKVELAFGGVSGSLWSSAYHLSKKQIKTIAANHRISMNEIMIPTLASRAHRPLVGYLSLTCHHCDTGVIPPIPSFYLRFCDYMNVIPHQLVPNTFVILAGLRRLFDLEFNREPSLTEIPYLYKFKPAPGNKNYYFLEAQRGCKPNRGLKSKVGHYQTDYFFVRESSRIDWNFKQASKYSAYV